MQLEAHRLLSERAGGLIDITKLMVVPLESFLERRMMDWGYPSSQFTRRDNKRPQTRLWERLCLNEECDLEVVDMFLALSMEWIDIWNVHVIVSVPQRSVSLPALRH